MLYFEFGRATKSLQASLLFAPVEMRLTFRVRGAQVIQQYIIQYRTYIYDLPIGYSAYAPRQPPHLFL